MGEACTCRHPVLTKDLFNLASQVTPMRFFKKCVFVKNMLALLVCRRNQIHKKTLEPELVSKKPLSSGRRSPAAVCPNRSRCAALHEHTVGVH